ncbi:Crp/Fnr family transcriptional regulator [Candidatus Nitrotoga sp. M5]|uniref:Crp/Fnr family transcriptional regulator n=1 Tax=Candidatus Nitrotoga sp. M5 TaxID=2890409 RepID=UPI001EF44522|nr:cyclic nucleotide-binding domain-containing protein [Candidatus Nitrotoga sp. M5]CAH1387466.1 Cyclic nucleotide-binding domain-containing protein [Candidatus Nitrotoga sp. M5]
MTMDDLILQTLRNSTLSEELRDAEIEALASVITVHEYKAGEHLLQPGNSSLRNTLMILATGEVEANATLDGEKATLHLLQPGDLAGIITFVGGSAAQISATVVAKTNSKMLLLERSRLESFLSTNPAIVYYVMRGVVRHVHGIVRRMNMQSVEMSNYIHQHGGRY